MPATPERMTLVQTEFRTVAAGPDATVIAKYGDAARDNKDDLIETFFHSTDDAQIFADERLSLLSRDAVRCDIAVQGEETGLALPLGGVVTTTLIDRERAIDRAMLITSARINFGKTATQLGTWG